MPSPSPSPSPPLEQSLRASPALSRTDLQYLQEWLAKQPHLPPLTETELVPFLHSNAYSLERTKACVERYFTMRTHAPEFFAAFDFDKDEFRSQLALHYYVVLPKRDAHGHRVVCSTFAHTDASRFDFEATTALIYAYLDVVVREEPTCPGFVFVMDSARTTFAHMAKVNISALSKSAVYFQQAMPLRMKAIHIINVNAVAEASYTLSKPFLGEEIQKLLHFHSGKMEKFYETFPKDMLPTEFGGTLCPLADLHNEFVDKLTEWNEWIKQLAQKQVQESKRPGQAKSAGDVFGLEGSFKKLDID